MQDQTQQTPGPWMIGPNYEAKNGKTVDVWHGSFSDKATTVARYVLPQDARLIASAPELLCMLNRLMDEVMMEEPVFSRIAPLTLEQARAALAKAIGYDRFDASNHAKATRGASNG